MATVLIVEDNELSRDALARRLERRGYEALLAVDGDDRDIALASGGDDFDTKPVHFQRLVEKIETLLANGAGR